jgi:pyruvate dehydrogenase E2 component (dihydrolipoamide acetyltransferase)
MARVAFEIPKIGLVMQAVKLQRWLKNVGDDVKVGEPLLEVETEKSVVEIEAAFGGRLVEILMPVGAEANVGDRVAWLESDARPLVVPPAPAPAAVAPPGAAAPAGAAAPPPATAAATGRVRSSPVARRLAAEHGLDLAQLAGSGPRGRVQLADVRAAIAQGGSAGTRAAAGALPAMRRALARAMSLSNASVPQFTLERAVDMTTLQAARAALALAQPPGAPRLSVNDFLLQALARTLLAYPMLNATFSGDAASADARIVPASGAHIGLVVAVENGLLVPVLHDVEKLGLAEIARRRADSVERGLAGRLKREELEGATCSLSNLSSRGPDRFAALINPPQSAILAVGRQRDCAVVRDGAVRVRPLCELTLTVDHRVADGRLAAEFLTSLCALLEGESWLF